MKALRLAREELQSGYSAPDTMKKLHKMGWNVVFSLLRAGSGRDSTEEEGPVERLTSSSETSTHG